MPQVQQLFDDPRKRQRSGSDNSFAMLDLWRVYLEQCPECGRTHGGGTTRRGGRAVGGPGGRPERHIYEYMGSVPEDLLCPLCGEVFQSAVQMPCGHHYCSLCVRTLLTRTAGRAACPLDGQAITRFAMRSPSQALVDRVEALWVRCPVCDDEVQMRDLHLHLQDPVSMVEEPLAYETILKPFYMSCPLSNFTVGEFNGSSSLIRFYRQLGEEAMTRFVLTTDSFIVLPDPKMGFQPHTDDDFMALQEHGGYFNAWWVHPTFRHEVWWQRHTVETDKVGSPSIGSSCGTPARSVLLLSGQDCSSEPWHASSFVHTWSTVQKPSESRYLCCLRDLRAEDVTMLESFQQSVLGFLARSYAVTDESKVWIFAHYPSSARYSTLHFHIVFAGSQSSRFEKYARKEERPHQLSRQFSLAGLIEVLKERPDHFETCTLHYFLGDKADLMDPISAFFGCSPHRYLHDFTFHWDPSVVAKQQESEATPKGLTVIAEPKKALLTSTGMVNRGGGGGGTSGAVSSNGAMDERVVVQLGELRLAVDSLRQGVEDLGKTVRDMARQQHLEENGACKLAALLAERVAPAAPFQVPLWAAALATVATAAAAAAAVAAALMTTARTRDGR